MWRARGRYGRGPNARCQRVSPPTPLHLYTCTTVPCARLQLYVVPNATSITRDSSAAAGAPLVLQRLIAWQRVAVAAGAAVDVNFTIPQSALYSTDATGARVVWPGTYALRFTNGGGDATPHTFDVPVSVAAPTVVERSPALEALARSHGITVPNYEALRA